MYAIRSYYGLKAKIDPDNKKEYIKSVRGEGYLFC